MTPRELQLAVDAAHDRDHDATVTLINTVRAFAMVHREGRCNFDLLEALAVAAEQQIETAQRLSLAHAALMDEKALSARLQSGNEERR